MNDNEPMLASEVLALRLRMNKTQLDMADLVGVSERTWCRWERGEQPVPEIAARLLARIATEEA